MLWPGEEVAAGSTTPVLRGRMPPQLQCLICPLRVIYLVLAKILQYFHGVKIAVEALVLVVIRRRGHLVSAPAVAGTVTGVVGAGS